jgi:polysaccharide biosynthesis transport protein
MSLRDYVFVLRRNWLLITITTLLGMALALGYSLLQQPQYQAVAKVYVSTQQASSAQDLSQGNTFAQDAIKGYAGVVGTPVVLDPVIDELRLDTTFESLSERVDANAEPNTPILVISVTDPSAKGAADVANAVSARLATVVPSLVPSSSKTGATVKVTSLQTAKAPKRPISPSLALDAAVGLLLGFLAGLGLAALRQTLDVRVRGERDVQAVTDKPVLGAIAYDSTAGSRPLIVQADPGSTRAESFRWLRTNLQFVDFEHRSHTMVVTSALAGEGKSTSAANLAIALADAGRRVLLVDADLRKPKMASYFGADGSVGLTDLLISRASLDQVIQPWGDGRLSLLPAGQRPPNPSELLQSEAMAEFVQTVSERFDTILFDAPPLLAVPDAAILTRQTAGAIMICAAGRTTKQQLRAAVARLEQVDAKIFGLVLTMVPAKGPDSYSYGYGYGDSDQKARGSRPRRNRRPASGGIPDAPAA